MHRLTATEVSEFHHLRKSSPSSSFCILSAFGLTVSSCWVFLHGEHRLWAHGVVSFRGLWRPVLRDGHVPQLERRGRGAAVALTRASVRGNPSATWKHPRCRAFCPSVSFPHYQTAGQNPDVSSKPLLQAALVWRSSRLHPPVKLISIRFYGATHFILMIY